MYRITLDDTEIYDLPDGMDNLVTEITREDGFANSEQILREKTSTTLTFWGDGYKYLASRIKITNCLITDIKIEKLCYKTYYTLFKGKIHISDIDSIELKYCRLSTPIRDNSFTGVVKDYLKTSVPLYNTNTKGCKVLTEVGFLASIGTRTVLSFDVLATLQFYVSYFTDNSLNVVSDYLTDNKYLFTTGFNMHNDNGALQKKYPLLSFDKLFSEIRKKTRIYMVIEFDYLGNEYIRIEDENYSFNGGLILELNDIDNIKEKIDVSRLYNSIEVGSNETDLDEPLIEDYYPTNDPIISFKKSVFNTCGECSVNSDSEQNKLDLVSDFIIDPNVILEALLEESNSNYSKDESIFLINYELIDGVPTAIRTTCNGVANVYNCSINNENVVNNWLGYSPQCLTKSRYPRDGFYIHAEDLICTIKGASALTYGIEDCLFKRIDKDYNNTIENSIAGVNIVYDLPPYSGNTTYSTDGIFNYYKCSKDGDYNLKTEIYNLVRDSNTSIISYQATLFITIYSDDTFQTIVSQYSTTDTSSNSQTDPITLITETGLIPFTVGQCAMVNVLLEAIGGIVALNYEFTNDSFVFYSDNTGLDCQVFDNEVQDSKPRLISFEYPISFNQYLNLREKKTGYFLILGRKFYIKNLKYIDDDISKFELIGNESLIE